MKVTSFYCKSKVARSNNTTKTKAPSNVLGEAKNLKRSVKLHVYYLQLSGNVNERKESSNKKQRGKPQITGDV